MSTSRKCFQILIFCAMTSKKILLTFIYKIFWEPICVGTQSGYSYSRRYRASPSAVISYETVRSESLLMLFTTLTASYKIVCNPITELSQVQFALLQLTTSIGEMMITIKIIQLIVRYFQILLFYYFVIKV